MFNLKSIKEDIKNFFDNIFTNGGTEQFFISTMWRSETSSKGSLYFTPNKKTLCIDGPNAHCGIVEIQAIHNMAMGEDHCQFYVTFHNSDGQPSESVTSVYPEVGGSTLLEHVYEFLFGHLDEDGNALGAAARMRKELSVWLEEGTTCTEEVEFEITTSSASSNSLRSIVTEKTYCSLVMQDAAFKEAKVCFRGCRPESSANRTDLLAQFEGYILVNGLRIQFIAKWPEGKEQLLDLFKHHMVIPSKQGEKILDLKKAILTKEKAEMSDPEKTATEFMSALIGEADKVQNEWLAAIVSAWNYHQNYIREIDELNAKYRDRLGIPDGDTWQDICNFNLPKKVSLAVDWLTLPDDILHTTKTALQKYDVQLSVKRDANGRRPAEWSFDFGSGMGFSKRSFALCRNGTENLALLRFRDEKKCCTGLQMNYDVASQEGKDVLVADILKFLYAGYIASYAATEQTSGEKFMAATCTQSGTKLFLAKHRGGRLGQVLDWSVERKASEEPESGVDMAWKPDLIFVEPTAKPSARVAQALEQVLRDPLTKLRFNLFRLCGDAYKGLKDDFFPKLPGESTEHYSNRLNKAADELEKITGDGSLWRNNPLPLTNIQGVRLPNEDSTAFLTRTQVFQDLGLGMLGQLPRYAPPEATKQKVISWIKQIGASCSGSFPEHLIAHANTVFGEGFMGDSKVNEHHELDDKEANKLIGVGIDQGLQAIGPRFLWNKPE